MGKEVTKGSARNIGVGVCEHFGDNIWLFGVWEVMAFIEIVADKGDREEHNLGKVVTKKWRVAKSDEPGICIRFSCRDNSSFRINQLTRKLAAQKNALHQSYHFLIHTKMDTVIFRSPVQGHHFEMSSLSSVP